MVRCKGVGRRRAKKTKGCDDDPAKSMPVAKKQKTLTDEDEEDTSTTKASENSGQKRLDQIESWLKPMSSLQTATIMNNLLSTVSQLQQLTANVKDRMAKGIVDASMEMIRDQGLLVDLTANVDAEVGLTMLEADEQIPVVADPTPEADEQVPVVADLQHDASLLLTRFLQDKRSGPNKYIPCRALQSLAHNILTCVKTKNDLVRLDCQGAREKNYKAMYLYIPESRKTSEDLEDRRRAIKRKAKAIHNVVCCRCKKDARRVKAIRRVAKETKGPC
jgi:hypothetical protein